MLDVGGLNYTIDSLYQKKSDDRKGLAKNLYGRISISNIDLNIKPETDSIYEGNIIDLFENKVKLQIVNLALNSLNSTDQVLNTEEQLMSVSDKSLNKHLIALHEKYVLGFACFILFFVGAPLGALIRKGGIGLPLVIAILLFLTYHFIGIFAKN